MLEFLKRLFGGSKSSVAEQTAPQATAQAAPVGKPWAPPVESDDAGGETIVYRRDATSKAGAPHVVRHGEAVTNESPLSLAVLAGSQKGQHFTIPMAGAVLGRSKECDFVLADTRVSSKHAWVGVVNGIAMIRDIGSTNGTFLNVSTQNLLENTPLSANDTIMLGGHYGLQLGVVHTKDAKRQ